MANGLFGPTPGTKTCSGWRKNGGVQPAEDEVFSPNPGQVIQQAAQQLENKNASIKTSNKILPTMSDFFTAIIYCSFQPQITTLCIFIMQTCHACVKNSPGVFTKAHFSMQLSLFAKHKQRFVDVCCHVDLIPRVSGLLRSGINYVL